MKKVFLLKTQEEVRQYMYAHVMSVPAMCGFSSLEEFEENASGRDITEFVADYVEEGECWSEFAGFTSPTELVESVNDYGTYWF